ncbi:unnamed protein product [Nesidiocoris tenuis]|uniref:Uncharacterized protein n=1 Tax=Nesidiocoris tenuis TaxID=355587 RepID=A0A6H5HR99_9HEMI|nr:unnamed protein product [Nesidiocoris tenuis]
MIEKIFEKFMHIIVVVHVTPTPLMNVPVIWDAAPRRALNELHRIIEAIRFKFPRLSGEGQLGWDTIEWMQTRIGVKWGGPSRSGMVGSNRNAGPGALRELTLQVPQVSLNKTLGIKNASGSTSFCLFFSRFCVRRQFFTNQIFLLIFLKKFFAKIKQPHVLQLETNRALRIKEQQRCAPFSQQMRTSIHPNLLHLQEILTMLTLICRRVHYDSEGIRVSTSLCGSIDLESGIPSKDRAAGRSGGRSPVIPARTAQCRRPAANIDPLSFLIRPTQVCTALLSLTCPQNSSGVFSRIPTTNDES